jgi:uncharacterized protein YecA (UPF0149 family)
MRGIRSFNKYVKEAVSSTLSQDLPREHLLATFENDIKVRQIEWTAKGSPITEAELEFSLNKQWKINHKQYERAGISYAELIEIGNKAIADTSGAVKQEKMISRIANLVGRNAPCPCDSGKKYKKCCGK